MAVLSVNLSPFSPDYSGVSSVLFDLNTVTAMHDASGCTGNYTGYDEPRWYGSKAPIFCSGLREIDAVLGNDEKLIQKMIHAAEDLNPDLMALVGSPVPMVIGSDMQGIAEELEARTGIPCLGFDTTGTAYYDRGVAMATISLLKRFTPKLDKIPGTVNIVGASPMDFGHGDNLEDVKQLIVEAGYEITACLSMGYTMEQLKKASSAAVNLAVSRAGYKIAEYMKNRYGIPYLCGLPVGTEAGQEYLNMLRQVMDTSASHIMNGSMNDESEILIIGEQVQSNAIRLALEKEYGRQGITVGCLFGMERTLALPQDKDLKTERLIRDEMNRSSYQVIIADPFMQQLLSPDTKVTFCSNAQYAVSSKVGTEKTARLIGKHFYSWFEKEIKRNGKI